MERQTCYMCSQEVMIPIWRCKLGKAKNSQNGYGSKNIVPKMEIYQFKERREGRGEAEEREGKAKETNLLNLFPRVNRSNFGGRLASQIGNFDPTSRRSKLTGRYEGSENSFPKWRYTNLGRLRNTSSSGWL